MKSGLKIMLAASLLAVCSLGPRPLHAALSANTLIDEMVTPEMKAYGVTASTHIYRGGLIGRDPAGYVKPFVPGDMFVGVAYEEVNNTSTAGSKTCRVKVGVEVVITLTSVALTDVGKPAFATADDTIALTGHPDAFVGRITAKHDTNLARVQLKRPGERAPDDGASTEIIWDGKARMFGEVLTAAGETYIGGAFRVDAIGAGIVTGAGVAPVPTVGETKMLLDNDNEAQNVTIETPAVFNITKGVTLEFEGRLSTAGGAATDDVDFGIMALSTTGPTDTERANMNATTSGLKSCLFHLDANANDVFASSDDDSSPIAATDTTFDNETVTNHKFVIIARPTGACEVWIDGVRKLSTTAFSVSTSGLFCGIVNLEKSTGTGVPALRVKRIRVAGAVG